MVDAGHRLYGEFWGPLISNASHRCGHQLTTESIFVDGLAIMHPIPTFA